MLIKVDSYKGRFEAMWVGNVSDYSRASIQGCPLGTGNTAEKAVINLCNRTNMESKTSFKLENVEFFVVEY